jgi:hypothetical protein
MSPGKLDNRMENTVSLREVQIRNAEMICPVQQLQALFEVTDVVARRCIGQYVHGQLYVQAEVQNLFLRNVW